MQQIASQNAPSPALVMPHFACGGLAWLLATFLMLLSADAFTGHYFHPRLLAITHLLTLAWVSMIIMGALYQLIPVILQVKLYSEKLAFISFYSLLAGCILLVLAFWFFRLGGMFHAAALLLTISFLFFAYTLFKTAASSPVKQLERDFILSAVYWLLFTLASGIVAGLHLRYAFLPVDNMPLLKLHAHAGLFGWFVLLIMGVGSKLLPMFMLSHNLPKHFLQAAFYLINAGLLLLVTAFYFDVFWLRILSASLLLMGVGSFLLYIVQAYRMRVKRKLDEGMQQTAWSFLFALLALLVAIVLLIVNTQHPFSTRLALLYGVLLLPGFVSSMVLGQTFKTLPFIVWLKHYRKTIGKGKQPLPNDLYSVALIKWQQISYVSGMLIFSLGVLWVHIWLIRAGAALLLVSAILYNRNLFSILLHKPTSYA